MHEWINEWMKLLSSLPNPFGFYTSQALSNPAWFLAHWSIENALLKLANNPFITKPNSQDFSVAFDKPSLKFFYYWFLGELINLVSFLHIWSLLLCLFPLLLLLYLTSCLERILHNPPRDFNCEFQVNEYKLAFLSSASSWAPGWHDIYFQMGFYCNLKFTMI